MKPSIKFSHMYVKLSSGNGLVQEAMLLDVIEVHMEHLSQPFRDYDTDKGKFPLPLSGVMNMLIFQDPYGVVFTTIRPTPSGDFYRENIGKVFDVLIKGRDY